VFALAIFWCSVGLESPCFASHPRTGSFKESGTWDFASHPRHRCEASRMLQNAQHRWGLSWRTPSNGGICHRQLADKLCSASRMRCEAKRRADRTLDSRYFASIGYWRTKNYVQHLGCDAKRSGEPTALSILDTSHPLCFASSMLSATISNKRHYRRYVHHCYTRQEL
jgi:hypothetical protein